MYLNVVAHTPVGKFVGYINEDSATEQECFKLRDALQQQTLSYLVLRTLTSEITLPAGVLANSVLVYTVSAESND